jgi:hypothetical protein
MDGWSSDKHWQSRQGVSVGEHEREDEGTTNTGTQERSSSALKRQLGGKGEEETGSQ